VPIKKKDRLERAKSLESDIEWLTRARDENKELLAEQEAKLARLQGELDELGCEFFSETGLPCRENSGRRARIVDVIDGIACCENHARIRRYSMGVAQVALS